MNALAGADDWSRSPLWGSYTRIGVGGRVAYSWLIPRREPGYLHETRPDR